jgi:hypothetical protein
MQLQYDDPDCQSFVDDLSKFGYQVSHVWRANWRGPSITVRDINAYLDVAALTDVRITRETLSEGGFLVRPLASGRLVNDPDTPE